jgi:hypothetical protein
VAESWAIPVSAIAIGQTVGAYAFFLPKLSEVRRADPGDVSMQRDVALGQVGAGGVSLTVGLLLAWLSSSSIPIWVTLFIAGIVASVYHYAMNGSV